MKAARVVKWALYLLLALALGIALGIPQGISSRQFERIASRTRGFTIPAVDITSNDYHAVNGVVPEFGDWGRGPAASGFERNFPPAAVTPSAQRSFFSRIVSAAVDSGELPAVIEGAAQRAIVDADSEERQESPYAGSPAATHSGLPAAILVYGERAQYFGQDVWCFLCLVTADGAHGTARVLVMSASPPFGLVHTQKVGIYGAE